mmetsp:Transcript_12724/g.37161  ORF Transcript_12724/g.37161 Transcript_12724/m.37161 type:complete len:265 (-) Transcript_12724:1938-2732(-)
MSGGDCGGGRQWRGRRHRVPRAQQSQGARPNSIARFVQGPVPRRPLWHGDDGFVETDHPRTLRAMGCHVGAHHHLLSSHQAQAAVWHGLAHLAQVQTAHHRRWHGRRRRAAPVAVRALGQRNAGAGGKPALAPGNVGAASNVAVATCGRGTYGARVRATCITACTGAVCDAARAGAVSNALAGAVWDAACAGAVCNARTGVVCNAACARAICDSCTGAICDAARAGAICNVGTGAVCDAARARPVCDASCVRGAADGRGAYGGG